MYKTTTRFKFKVSGITKDDFVTNAAESIYELFAKLNAEAIAIVSNELTLFIDPERIIIECDQPTWIPIKYYSDGCVNDTYTVFENLPEIDDFVSDDPNKILFLTWDILEARKNNGYDVDMYPHLPVSGLKEILNEYIRTDGIMISGEFAVIGKV